MLPKRAARANTQRKEHHEEALNTMRKQQSQNLTSDKQIQECQQASLPAGNFDVKVGTISAYLGAKDRRLRKIASECICSPTPKN